MDVLTVSNAVNDALSGLPAGTSDFIKANIGTPAGQQAILQAGMSLGLSQAQIASAVSQATGMTVTPQQVAQVAQSVAAPAPTPAPANISAPAPVSAQTGTPLTNIPQFVGSAAPGSVGTNYGQASGGQIASVQKGAPDFATALQNGTASLNYDANSGTYNLIDSKTGTAIPGNYQIQTGQNGAIGINVPAVNGSMIQIATKMNQDGSIPPVTTKNVLNVGLNAGAGGLTGGFNDLKPLLTQAALMYAGSQLSDYLNTPSGGTSLNQIGDVPTDFSATTSPVYSPDVTGTPLAGINANVPTTPLTDVGTPISQVSNVTNNPAWNGTELTPAQVAANTNPIDLTSLSNGGVQNFGAGAITNANIAGMNTAYTNAMANGGFTSGYQTLPNGSRVMIQNDGTAIQVNPVTGATTALNPTQVQNLVSNGQLNSSASGYNSATGGTTTAPGGGTINPNGTTTLPNGGTVTTPTNSVAPTTNALGLTPVQTAAGLIGGAYVLGNLSTNQAIANAAGTQAQAGQASQNVLSDFGKTYGQLQAPYQQTGVQATNQLGALGSGTYNIMNPDGTVNSTGTGSGYQTHQFNAADLAAGLAPNYDFMLAQGQGANRNLANVGGGLLSGNTLQGLNKYTQDYAGNAYQNAFNNYQTQRQNIFGNLAQQAGLGQTSLGQLGQVGSNLAQTYGNITTGLAASQAGAQTAQAVNNANLLSNLAKTAAVVSLA